VGGRLREAGKAEKCAAGGNAEGEFGGAIHAPSLCRFAAFVGSGGCRDLCGKPSESSRILKDGRRFL
jgi:hypothetical protein